MRIIGVTLTALAIAGCATAGAPAGQRAAADLKNAAGQSIGSATFTEQADGKVRIVVQATGLTPGAHGIHVHAVGRCEPADFASAGGHYNPRGARHGLEAADGPHAGDLPNLDADGSALVIHEKADDQKSDPAGNSGARVACGVIARPA